MDIRHARRASRRGLTPFQAAVAVVILALLALFVARLLRIIRHTSAMPAARTPVVASLLGTGRVQQEWNGAAMGWVVSHRLLCSSPPLTA
jgi:hypothetical protein